MKTRFPAVAVVAVLVAAPAMAQTLYKLIDKNGKVTYSETPPKNFDGKVIRMDIDPNANTAVMPRPGAAPAGSLGNRDTETGRKEISRRGGIETDIERARQRVEDAKQRLQDLLDNPGDSDVVRMGRVGGGARPVLTEEYQARVARAEADVKAAEEELARLTAAR